jgi:hypothetical protein
MMGGVMLEDGGRAQGLHGVRRTWWRGGRRDDVQVSRELRPGVHALWVSAKGAVDDDLVQSALEEGELLIIELGDEQLRDPAGVDGRRLG